MSFGRIFKSYWWRNIRRKKLRAITEKLYKLREGSTNNILDPLATVFQNRGIKPEDVEWYKNPTPFEYDGSTMKNMKEALDLVIKHKDNKIFLPLDKDMDGLTSGALFIMALKRHYPEVDIHWAHQKPHRKHGIDLSLIPEDVSLVVAIDGGSNDFKQHRILKEQGIDVIVLDHHPASHYSTDALVVNPQLDDYENKEISGVGVAYKFAQELDKRFNTNYADDYLDLTSVGMIGDAMDTSSKETRWLIQKG